MYVSRIILATMDIVGGEDTKVIIHVVFKS